MPTIALPKSSTLVDGAAWSLGPIFFCQKENPRAAPALPPEILGKVAGYLMQLEPPGNHGDEQICARKPQWNDVRGFMEASPELHYMGFVLWVRVLTVRDHADWEKILELSNLVQELTCEDGAFGKGVLRSILTRLPKLHTIRINSHGDITRNETGQFSYRDLFRELPSSLLRFEITHAHGPDLKVIETLKTCCPNLEVLRLGRCTMFNTAPACDFWAAYPFDHDAYISIAGTEDYAHSVAQELVGFKKLESLRLGVYFIPSIIVLAHRAFHVRGMQAPLQLTWQQALTDLLNLSQTEPPQEPQSSQLVALYHQAPEAKFGPDTCSFCRDLALEESGAAEHAANAILKNLVPSLRTIEWMSWFTPSHLGVSSHVV